MNIQKEDCTGFIGRDEDVFVDGERLMGIVSEVTSGVTEIVRTISFASIGCVEVPRMNCS